MTGDVTSSDLNTTGGSSRFSGRLSVKAGMLSSVCNLTFLSQ